MVTSAVLHLEADVQGDIVEQEANTISESTHFWPWMAETVPLGRPEEATMIEVVLNDRLGKKIRVKCNEDDTVGDLKKLVAAQVGTRPEKIRIQKWYTIYKDHITLEDYEIHDGMGLELYYTLEPLPAPWRTGIISATTQAGAATLMELSCRLGAAVAKAGAIVGTMQRADDRPAAWRKGSSYRGEL
ncbi:hypothetical protein ON010_g18793 [Phytophthora cinnamomi]|nr:hypothetical protein ON010_g18793 [Phytophthora cinnamomi]